MGVRSIQILSFALLSATALIVVAQTTPSGASSECRLPRESAARSVELASLFTGNADDADAIDAGLFSAPPAFVYALNEIAMESRGVTLVDVSDVTTCDRHKNII